MAKLFLILLAVSLSSSCSLLGTNKTAPLPEDAQVSFSFAVMGDVPYGPRQIKKLDGLIEEINADNAVDLVLHAGDIKDGNTPCDNHRITSRFQQFQQIQTAFIFTPGDNDWTDCHRRAAGRYDPLERLTFLRRTFFPEPQKTSGQQAIDVDPQSRHKGFKNYVENIVFEYKNIIFITLHVVGSNNNLAPYNVDQPQQTRLAEFDSRDKANHYWLNYGFELAQKKQAKGVVILAHADMRLKKKEGAPGRIGFNTVIRTLTDNSRQFKKPVLLVHGDSHLFIADYPIASVSNLMRLQSFGAPYMRWVKISVAPESAQVFFIEKGSKKNKD